jgi:hypothetical protein
MKKQASNTLYLVHCVDTEGPLDESLEATFERLATSFGIRMAPNKKTLAQLQRCEFDLGGKEESVARMLAPELLRYNSSWDMIASMLEDILSPTFRNQMLDDSGRGWIFSWHCMDHIGLMENPRRKDLGYGNVFRFYRQALAEMGCRRDELNWHFHPLSLTSNPLHGATSYTINYSLLNEILCRRILDDQWFPVVNRPGFHAERPDSHAFLEQWIPYDYANQSHEEDESQMDLQGGRFGDWRRAPTSWRGYRPSHDDYQLPGDCRRSIFRCLNVGTRLRGLNAGHVRQAFREAGESGSAILAFADHDYRDMRPDVEIVRGLLAEIRPEFPDVALRFAGAEEAARAHLGVNGVPAPKLVVKLEGNRLDVQLEAGEIFGPQPFLALRTRDGRVFHDNFDFQVPGRHWTYVLDYQTIDTAALSRIGVGVAGRYGKFDVVNLDLNL